MPGEDRPIPFSRMIFIGDGDTDVPSFKMMMVQGGTSIAVFDPDEWADKGHSKTHDLIAEQRVHFVAPAVYTETSQLDIVVRAWDSSAATQPESEAALWNPKGYVNNARPHLRVHAV